MHTLRLILAATILCLPSYAQADYRTDQRDLLQEMAQAYEQGDIGRFTGLFAYEATHANKPIAQELPGYHDLFAKTNKADRSLRFYDISTHPDGSGAAWVYAKATEPCAGLVEWETANQKITSWHYECYSAEAPQVPTERFDGALIGQAADSATTAAALASGATELNPLVAAAPEIILPAKLILSEVAETWENPTCRAVKDSLAGFGMGAGAWNVAIIAGANPPLAGVLGIIAGIAWHRETEAFHAAACREDDTIDYALISSTEIRLSGI